MSGLVDDGSTGLCFGAGLTFESGLGGPLGLDIIPAGEMITEAGIAMISEADVIMVTES